MQCGRVGGRLLFKGNPRFTEVFRGFLLLWNFVFRGFLLLWNFMFLGFFLLWNFMLRGFLCAQAQVVYIVGSLSLLSIIMIVLEIAFYVYFHWIL